MDWKVELREQPAQTVVSKRFRTSLAGVGQDIGAAFGAIFAYLGEVGEGPSGAPFGLFPETDFNADDFEMELCVPVSRMPEPRGDIIAREVPGGEAAATIHKGPYSETAGAYRALGDWVREHGYRIAGPAREVWLNDPNQVEASELLTEISFPVAKALRKAVAAPVPGLLAALRL